MQEKTLNFFFKSTSILSSPPADCSRAGQGTLQVEVRNGAGQLIRSDATQKSTAVYELSFTPRDTSVHTVDVKFNDCVVPGSPLQVQVIDSSSVRIETENLQNAPLHKNVAFDIDPHGAPDADVEVTITAPSGRPVPFTIERVGGKYRVNFTPNEVGNHRVNVTYGGGLVYGSPFDVDTHDARKVIVEEIDLEDMVGCEMSFIGECKKSSSKHFDFLKYVFTSFSNILKT